MISAVDVNWPELIARVHAGERAKDVAREYEIDGRVLRMKALHADTEWVAAYLDRTKAAMADPEVKARHAAAIKAAMADPEVKARQAAGMKRSSILSRLSDAERADYDITKRKMRYTRAEALDAIGRTDLLPVAAE